MQRISVQEPAHIWKQTAAFILRRAQKLRTFGMKWAAPLVGSERRPPPLLYLPPKTSLAIVASCIFEVPS